MEFQAVLRNRRSIRRFKSTPVAADLVRELLDQARWSPSWANTQGWHVFVATGATLERIQEDYRNAEDSGQAPSPDFRMPDRNWPEPMRSNNQALIQVLESARQLEPTAPARGLALGFGAPCLLLVAVDRRLAPDCACFDAGLFVQSLCLAAHDRGLGTCIMARAVRHPHLLRAALPGAAGMAFVAGVALGYPEPDTPINTFQRPRAALEGFVTWTD
jgi:nitroreductase